MKSQDEAWDEWRKGEITASNVRQHEHMPYEHHPTNWGGPSTQVVRQEGKNNECALPPLYPTPQPGKTTLPSL